MVPRVGAPVAGFALIAQGYGRLGGPLRPIDLTQPRRAAGAAHRLTDTVRMCAKLVPSSLYTAPRTGVLAYHALQLDFQHR